MEVAKKAGGRRVLARLITSKWLLLATCGYEASITIDSISFSFSLHQLIVVSLLFLKHILNTLQPRDPYTFTSAWTVFLPDATWLGLYLLTNLPYIKKLQVYTPLPQHPLILFLFHNTHHLLTHYRFIYLSLLLQEYKKNEVSSASFIFYYIPSGRRVTSIHQIGIQLNICGMNKNLDT